MTRQEFSKMLSDKRKENGQTIKDVCLKIGLLTGDVVRIEKGLNNYKMQRCYEYMSAIKTTIEVQDERDTVLIKDTTSLVEFIKRKRKEKKYSQCKLAQLIDRVPRTIEKMESGESALSVDVFLKSCEALNVSFALKYYE